MTPKYSIVIGTKDHLDQFLKPCLESIKTYTDMEQVEVIVVANGCTDNETDKYVQSLGEPFKLISYKEALGYPKANNVGIFDGSHPEFGIGFRARGEYIVLLNNDTVLLPQGRNQWLNMLVEPFEKDPQVGLTGPMKGPSAPAGHDFLIFFCVMIKKEVFLNIGPLNEIFGVGGGEDTDFCIRAERAGYKVVEIAGRGEDDPANKRGTGAFPIFHHSGATVSQDPKWQEIFNRNSMILAKKYNPEYHKWLLSNNCERAVFGKGDDIKNPLFRREHTRYEYAAKNLKGKRVLEIGCSSGYGSSFLAPDIDYIGVDYDAAIIEYANLNFADENHKFYHMDAHDIPWEEWGHFDTIIAYEFLEHIHDGKSFAQMLKGHCDNLLCTTPFREPPGLWGPHHVLHRLCESDFPGFEYNFVHENGDLGDVPDHDNGINLMLMRWERGKEYPYRPRILASIPTRGRYEMLAHTLQAVALQTVRPHKIIVFDDGEHRDLREDAVYKHILRMFDERGIEWEFVFTPGMGQHFSHQTANNSGYPLVWRIDDDEVPEPDVLEKLLSHMTSDVGAVGGAVIIPGQQIRGGSGNLEDVYHKPNIQWHAENKVVEVDHLYSSFLYRAGIVSYCLDLSPMAHREETIFTYKLKREGYRLLVDLSAKTYHYQQASGGIRTEGIYNQLNAEKDEAIFTELMDYWGYKLINLDVGLGDHLVFLHLIPALKKKYKHIVIGCAYPDVFSEHPDIQIIPCAESQKWRKENVYKWMSDHQWKRSILEAFEMMYGVKAEVREEIFA